MWRLRAAVLGCAIALASGSAHAVTMQLGTQDFADGQILPCFSACANGWMSATDPFNKFLGSDPGIPGATNFSAEWSFDLGALSSRQIAAARIEIGLFDLDSSAPGSQLDSFVLNPGVGAIDLSSLLDPVLEVSGVGEQQEYNVVAIGLPQAALQSLLGKTAARFALKLKGPAWIAEIPTQRTVLAQGTNGAGLDFVRIILSSVPEPAPALLFALGCAALVAIRRRR
jgi:hypothetical protein